MWFEPHFENIFGVMTMNTKMLKDNVLFKGLTDDEMTDCLKELKAAKKAYKKDTVILHA